MITTKYLGPTTYRGSRVVARSASGVRYIHPWDYGVDVRGNHTEAFKGLAHKINTMDRQMDGERVGEQDHDGGFVFVCLTGRPRVIIREG